VALLHTFVKERRLAYVFDSTLGFRLPGGNVRVPDVSFVAQGRCPGEQVTEGFGDLAPDLAVEVLSPDDRSRDVLHQLGLTEVRALSPDDSLDGADVVPGFRCRLADVID
jgi:Uma2 family endonuclease